MRFLLALLMLALIPHAAAQCVSLTNGTTYLNADTSLCAGQYNRSLLFLNASNMVLDCSGAVLEGGATGVAITVDGVHNTTVKNCVIRNYSSGYKNSFVDFSNEDFVLNTTFLNNTKAVDLSSNYYVRILNSTFRENFYGIYASNLDYLLVEANLFENNSFAPVQFPGSTATRYGIIRANRFTNHRHGTSGQIDIDGQLQYYDIDSNLFEHNNNTAIITSSSLVTEYTNITNNTITNVTNGTAANGMTLYAARNLRILNNTITRMGYSGILISQTNANDNLVMGNTLRTGSVAGVKVELYAANTTLRDNYIEGYTYPVYLDPYATHGLVYNNILNASGSLSYNETHAWNASLNCSMQNIVGGGCAGGNYWANPSGTGYSQTCADADVNGICDVAYNASGVYDALPLATPSAAIPPGYSAALNITPATYNASAQLRFNLTWTDDVQVDAVIIQLNRSGTLLSYSGGNTTDTSFNLTLTGFPAGSHSWRSIANDSSGSQNATPWYGFTISQAAPQLDLTMNGSAANLTLGEGIAIWLNGSLIAGDAASLELYLNGTLLSNATAPANLSNITYAALYNVTLRYRGSENYSTGSATLWLTVQDTRAPVVLSHGPTGTVTSDSTTLSATTDEYATCGYATASTAFESMSLMSGNTTSHSVSLSGLSSGSNVYYILCNSTGGAVSTQDYPASLTVSISSGGGGGGGGAPPAQTNSSTYVLATDRINITISKEEVPFTRLVAELADSVAAEIKVESLEERPQGVTLPGREVYRYVQVSHGELRERFATLEFRVPLSIAAGKDVVLLRFTTAWDELPTEKLRESGNYVYYRAESPGLSVFAIAFKAALPEVEEAPPESEPTAEQPPSEEPAPEQVPPESSPRRRSPLLRILALLAAIFAGTILGALWLRKRS